MLPVFDGLRNITLASVAFRLILSTLCGGIVGMEREFKRRSAGFRTHILICLGAAMTTLTSEFWLVYMRYYLDAARLGAGVVAGMGFIGAGTIIVTRRQRVKGLTTAAGLWTIAIVGLAIGAGMYIVGVFATLMIIVLQVLLHKRLLFLEGPQSEQISITMERGLEPFQMLRDNLESINVQILEVKTQKNKDDTVSLELAVRVDQSLTVTEILACFQENPYIRALDI